MASLGLRFLFSLLFSLVLLVLVPAERVTAENGRNTPALGVLTGEPAGSESVFVREAAELFGTEGLLRVIPKPGNAGLNNIAALLTDPRVDLAFVSGDALAQALTSDADGTLGSQLELVLKLAPHEIHVVARSGITSLADLAGKRVNVGPAGSSAAIAAGPLFKALNIAVEPISLDAQSAMAKLKDGTIAAVVVVGAKPTPLISEIPAGLGLHLLPIEFGPDTEPRFLPARFEQRDYPNLIAGPDAVPTLAAGMVLLAAKEKAGSTDKVARFVTILFSRFGDLQAQDKHPKWRDINLAAAVPGLTRTAAAKAWLAQRATRVEPIAASAAGTDLPSLQSEAQKEALFEKFIEWRRAKGH
jgi:TRAP transporter TAXI family solute receptor